MATARPQDALLVPGRLCVAPTDLSLDFPHGGTALGLVRGVEWVPGKRPAPVTAEEWGGHVTQVIEMAETATLACFYRQWDADALQKTALDTEAGSSTARRRLRVDVGTDGTRPGTDLTAKGVTLYFSPDANQHPGVLIFRAIPVTPTAAMRWAASENLEVPAVWYCTVCDVSGAKLVADVGLRLDLHGEYAAWL